jgi:hypothetical protein
MQNLVRGIEEPLAPVVGGQVRERRQPQQPSVAPTAYASIRQHTSAYDSIRQHTSAYVRERRQPQQPSVAATAYVSIRQHTSAYVSIRQHTLRIRCAYATHTCDAPRVCARVSVAAYATHTLRIR